MNNMTDKQRHKMHFPKRSEKPVHPVIMSPPKEHRKQARAIIDAAYKVEPK